MQRIRFWLRWLVIHCRSSLSKLGRYRFLFLFFLVPFRPSADTQACLPLPAPSQGESKDTSVRMDFFFLSDWASPNQKEKLIRPLISMDNRIFWWISHWQLYQVANNLTHKKLHRLSHKAQQSYYESLSGDKTRERLKSIRGNWPHIAVGVRQSRTFPWGHYQAKLYLSDRWIFT